MESRRLGKSGITVSSVCLGTMTFGSSCDEKEAFRIMDTALEMGIDFFDTAELYPVPPKEEWMHETERIIGKWLKGKDRYRIILASKVAGAAHGWFKPPLRGQKTAIDGIQIRKAIEGSLSRLGTDYLDLYQIHWPDHEFGYEEVLETLEELIRDGLIRVIGTSNDSAWGLMKATATAENLRTHRFETIQNNFSLVNRRFEDALADICRRESISLLPYSPLGGGVLTGKYQNGQFPEGARFSKYLSEGKRQKKMVQRFVNEKALNTVAGLLPLAQEMNLSPAALALAWSKQHDFVASTIVGANSVDQLRESMEGADVRIPKEILKKINQLSETFPYPLG